MALGTCRSATRLRALPMPLPMPLTRLWIPSGRRCGGHQAPVPARSKREPHAAPSGALWPRPLSVPLPGFNVLVLHPSSFTLNLSPFTIQFSTFTFHTSHFTSGSSFLSLQLSPPVLRTVTALNPGPSRLQVDQNLRKIVGYLQVRAGEVGGCIANAGRGGALRPPASTRLERSWPAGAGPQGAILNISPAACTHSACRLCLCTPACCALPLAVLLGRPLA